MPDLEIRELEAIEDLRAAAAVWEEVWGERRIVTPELLRALATHGGEVLGAYRDGELVGAQMAFLGRMGDAPVLHSHVTGVLPGLQHAGIGSALKWAQRDWALARGIEIVTWTFDPMLARNAYVNLHKLGARAERFHRAFYGTMDDAFNLGERTDRLEIVWRLRDPRVVSAAEGDPQPARMQGAEPALESAPEGPRRRPVEAGLVTVQVPPDYLVLRSAEPELAARWRDAVADTLEHLLDRGYAGAGFLREGSYVLERA